MFFDFSYFDVWWKMLMDFSNDHLLDPRRSRFLLMKVKSHAYIYSFAWYLARRESHEMLESRAREIIESRREDSSARSCYVISTFPLSLSLFLDWRLQQDYTDFCAFFYRLQNTGREFCDFQAPCWSNVEISVHNKFGLVFFFYFG